MPSTDNDVVTLRWVMLAVMESIQDQWQFWERVFTECLPRYPELRGHIAAFTSQLQLLTDAIRQLYDEAGLPPAVVNVVTDINTGSSTNTAGSTAALASGRSTSTRRCSTSCQVSGRMCRTVSSVSALHGRS